MNSGQDHRQHIKQMLNPYPDLKTLPMTALSRIVATMTQTQTWIPVVIQ